MATPPEVFRIAAEEGLGAYVRTVLGSGPGKLTQAVGMLLLGGALTVALFVALRSGVSGAEWAAVAILGFLIVGLFWGGGAELRDGVRGYTRPIHVFEHGLIHLTRQEGPVPFPWRECRVREQVSQLYRNRLAKTPYHTSTTYTLLRDDGAVLRLDSSMSGDVQRLWQEIKVGVRRARGGGLDDRTR